MREFPTHAEVDAMKSRGYEPATIVESRRLADLGVRAAALRREIEPAFAGVVLGDGTGYFEALGIDDHYDAAALAACRLADEKSDWRRFDEGILNVFGFMNAEGKRFHLPAYLVADIMNLPGSFSALRLCPRVADYSTGRVEWSVQEMYELRDILTPAQRRCVREYLLISMEVLNSTLESFHCVYITEDIARIERALEELWVEV